MFIKNPCYDPDPAIHAMNIARHYVPETPENKTWVMDQMVRALTRCPIAVKTIPLGREIAEIEILSESQDYLRFLSNHPNWDQGIPP